MLCVWWAMLAACSGTTGGPSDGDETIVYPGTIQVTAKVPAPDNVTYESVDDMVPLAVLLGQDPDEMEVLTRGVTGSMLGGIPIDKTFEIRLGKGDFTTEDAYWVAEIDGVWRVHPRLYAQLSQAEYEELEASNKGLPIDALASMFAGENEYRCTITTYQTVGGMREEEPLYTLRLEEQWISLREGHMLMPETDRTFGGVLSETQYLQIKGNVLEVWDEAWENEEVEAIQPITTSVIEVDGDFSAIYTNTTASQESDITCDNDGRAP